jgi:hypothetical protein
MSCTPDTWLLVAPAAAEHLLSPLTSAHRVRRPVRVARPDADWTRELDDVAGVLLVGDRRRTPRTALPGPFLPAADGRRVPVGFVPHVAREDLERFASAAAEVQARSSPAGGPAAGDELGPLAFLGQWDDHVVRMVARSRRILDARAPVAPVLFWTADRIVRRDLLVALRAGLGLALYFGHGRPYGWAGYHGLHTRHLVYARGRPTGAMISLTCHTANRHKVALSFSEALVVHGIAAAAFGAVRPTRTVDNWWWGTSLCELYAERPATTLGELIVRACPPRPEQWESYRILGDPLAPLVGAPGAAAASRAVFAPAPHESPTPPGYLAELEPATSSAT